MRDTALSAKKKNAISKKKNAIYLLLAVSDVVVRDTAPVWLRGLLCCMDIRLANHWSRRHYQAKKKKSCICILMLLCVCPHIYCYMSPHTCVLILRYVCPHTTIWCPHASTCASARDATGEPLVPPPLSGKKKKCYISILKLVLHACPHICVLILLYYMCPHTSICVLILLYVSSY